MNCMHQSLNLTVGHSTYNSVDGQNVDTEGLRLAVLKIDFSLWDTCGTNFFFRTYIYIYIFEHSKQDPTISTNQNQSKKILAAF